MSTTTQPRRERLLNLVDSLITVENGEASEMEILETIGEIIRLELVGSLQGSWQRTIFAAIEAGLIDPETGNMTDHALDLLGEIGEA